MTLADFLLARIGDDEAVAREALDPKRPGTHWQWFNDDDTPSAPDSDTGGEYLTWPTSLRSAEEFPTPLVGALPAFLIHTAEEVRAGAAAHIARHDPARVLAECEAKRQIVEDWQMHAQQEGPEAQAVARVLLSALCVLAAPYADHPDYDESWRP